MNPTQESNNNEKKRRIPLWHRFFRRQGRRERSRGQSLVELALTLPFLFTLFLGMVEVAYYMYAANTVHNTAREVARIAAKESRYESKTMADWATLAVANVTQSATGGNLSLSSSTDTLIVTRFTTDASGTLTYCQSQSANWPSDGLPGPDTTKFSCAGLQAKITQMATDLGTNFEDDDFIIMEYFHHHIPIINLTVVMPNGITLYSYSTMRIIGQ